MYNTLKPCTGLKPILKPTLKPMDIYVNASESVRVFSTDGQLRGEIAAGMVQDTDSLISEVTQSRKLATMHRLIKRVIERVKNQDYSTGLLAGLRGDHRKTGVMHLDASRDVRWRGFESTDYYPEPPKSLSGNALQQFMSGWHDGYLLRKWGLTWELFNKYHEIIPENPSWVNKPHDGVITEENAYKSRVRESIDILVIETESRLESNPEIPENPPDSTPVQQRLF